MKTFLSPKPVPAEPPAKPLPEPQPTVPVTWALLVDLLDYSKLLTPEVKKTLKAGGAEFEKSFARLDAFSHTEAKREFRRMLEAAIAGDSDAKNVPTRESIADRNANIRRVIKTQTAEISAKYCAIAADVLEKSLDHLPAFVENLMKQEAAVSAIVPRLGPSPLRQLCDKLPDYIKFHVAQLRDTRGAMINPSQLFNV